MHVVLLGAPGTGKGTQAELVAGEYHWPHVSSGDMLREHVGNGTALGMKAKAFMDAGALVPDDLVISMLIERISRDDCKDGALLDGFPRNLAQAMALDGALAKAGQAIDVVPNITVPDDELVKRLSGRWLCRNCGAIYNENGSPPKVAGKCDKCGGELYQRDDDKPATVRVRLQQQKPPADMLDHYRSQGKLVEIDGFQPVAGVTSALVAAIEGRRK
jgi:adenylate kinase